MYGVCFDDNDFLRDIKYRSSLHIKCHPIIGRHDKVFPYRKNYDTFVIHQHHEHFSYVDIEIKKYWEQNKRIFIERHNDIVNYTYNLIKSKNLWNNNIICNIKCRIFRNNDKVTLKFDERIESITLNLNILEIENIEYTANAKSMKFFENIRGKMENLILKCKISGKERYNILINDRYKILGNSINMTVKNINNNIKLVIGNINNNKLIIEDIMIKFDEKSLINI